MTDFHFQMNRIPILTPPMPFQAQIVEVLVTLDDKIDWNRRMNESLKAMARWLFTSWFVVTPEFVVLTKLNPLIPRVWLPHPSQSRRSLCSTESLVLKPREWIPREYLHSLVSSGTFFKMYEIMVTGTSDSHQRIRTEHLINMSVDIPTQAVRKAFSETVSDCYQLAETSRRNSLQLSRMRDKLLPQLLPGELAVSDAGQQAGRSV